MTDQSDRQTSIFSSYKGENKFWYKFLVKHERLQFTPEIRKDLKEFVKKSLEYFDEYNIVVGLCRFWLSSCECSRLSRVCVRLLANACVSRLCASVCICVRLCVSRVCVRLLANARVCVRLSRVCVRLLANACVSRLSRVCVSACECLRLASVCVSRLCASHVCVRLAQFMRLLANARVCVRLLASASRVCVRLCLLTSKVPNARVCSRVRVIRVIRVI